MPPCSSSRRSRPRCCLTSPAWRRSEGHAAFARAIRLTVLAIAAFAAAVALGLLIDRPVRDAPRAVRPDLRLRPLRARPRRSRDGHAPRVRARSTRPRWRATAHAPPPPAGWSRPSCSSPGCSAPSSANRCYARRSATSVRQACSRRCSRCCIGAVSRRLRPPRSRGRPRRALARERSPSRRRTPSRPRRGRVAPSRVRCRRPPPAPPSAPAPSSSARSRAIFCGERAMNDWPPHPGLTVMHSARSIVPASSASASTGVAGLIATPTHAPPRADLVRGVLRVRGGLHMEGDRVRPGAHELPHLALRALDHQVHVEHPPHLLAPARAARTPPPGRA